MTNAERLTHIRRFPDDRPFSDVQWLLAQLDVVQDERDALREQLAAEQADHAIDRDKYESERYHHGVAQQALVDERKERWSLADVTNVCLRDRVRQLETGAILREQLQSSGPWPVVP